VISFLADPATHGGTKPIERFETHGNLVFLAGTEAWKIKRAVRFAYMDFSTLELGWDVGAFSPAWTSIDAGGTSDETLRRASAAAGIGITKPEGQRP
jgi:hypothetical protein